MKKILLLIFVIIPLLIVMGCKSKKDIVTSPEEINDVKVLYEKAKKYMRKDPDKCRLLFKEVIQKYPQSLYGARSKIGIADSYFKQKGAASLIIAATEYQEYVNLFPNSPDAIYAKFQIGMCYHKQSKKAGRDQYNTTRAIKYFESMIRQFPGTREAQEAEKLIAKNRQKLAKHFFSIGLTNYRYRAYEGAISRFKQVIENYPDFESNDKLYYYIGKTYYKMNNLESAFSFFQKIISSYQKSKYFSKATRMVKTLNKKLVDKGDNK